MKCSQIIKEYLFIVLISTAFLILQWVVNPMNPYWIPNKYSFIVSILYLISWFIYGIYKYDWNKKLIVYGVLFSAPIIIEFSYMSITANGTNAPLLLNIIFYMFLIPYIPLLGLSYILNKYPNMTYNFEFILYFMLPLLASILGFLFKTIWRKMRK